jgi:hypothetical protein
MEYSEPLAPGEPPENPDDWSDEQWIAWLKLTDSGPYTSDELPVSTLGSKLARSSSGQALGQAMLGLAAAIYGPKDEDQVIIVEGTSSGEDDEPFAVLLDFEHPEQSSVVFKTDEKEESDDDTAS